MNVDIDPRNSVTEAQATVQMSIAQAKELVDTYLNNGQLGAAKVLVQQLQQLRPMDAEVDLLAATCEFHSGHPSIARSLVFKAGHAAPDLDKVKAALADYNLLERNLAANAYRNAFLVWRNRYMDFPMNIQLETAGRCNAKCDFCPHSELDRKLEVMSDALFEKIINDAGMIPQSSPLNFFMNVVNEPFMDKKIFSRMQMLNDRIPHATIGMYTNMNVMPPLFFEKLSKIKKITYWNVSFNAANKEEYEKSMVIDFGRTVANIKRFLHENRMNKIIDGPIYLSRIGNGGEADSRFMEECKALFAEYDCGKDFIPECRNRADWFGLVGANGQSKVPSLMPCYQWFNISIHCNGIVPHCCMDAKGEFPFGDVNKNSLLGVYNSPHFRNLRENVISRDVIYPCNSCALL